MVMNKKKILPLISMFVLSALTVPFSFLVLWNLDADSKTVADQFKNALTITIPSSITLILLVWFGAGLDYALSWISKKAIRIFVSILVYVFIPAICCIGMPLFVIASLSGVLEEGFTKDAGFGFGLLSIIALIPAATGFLFIYLGAGVSSVSRWAAGRIWTEPQEVQPVTPASETEQPHLPVDTGQVDEGKADDGENYARPI
ncbi:MAG: hypothetical protein IPO22_17705 [Anaerolineales bacterium]|nr:hypothetical protein [Anaerolineales bacterium]